MKTRTITRLTVVLLGILCATSLGQWVDVAPALSYRDYTLEGPIRVFVTRADRSKDNWVFDTMIAQGSVINGRETVPDMVKRYDDSVNFEGTRYDIKAAINGSYFNMRTGYPSAGQIISGWFALRFGEYSGSTGFIWTFDRDFILCGNVRNDREYQRIVFADKAKMSINEINKARGENELVVYTQHYAASTGTSGDGVEVLVQLDGPMCIQPRGDQNIGTIVEIRRDKGSTLLPFDHVVLSASGKAAKELLARAHKGEKLRIELGNKDFGNKAVKLAPHDWRGAYAGITGHCYCLVDGVVHSEHWESKARKKIAAGGKSGAVVQDPRSVLAANDEYLYFVVADGRSAASKGFTFTQAGEFCRDKLKATNAILQDGGGSSIMWVNGEVKNVPSDGQPRAVANGFCFALTHKPEISNRFTTGSRVACKRDDVCRLGPGTQYGEAGRAAKRQAGVVLEHKLNGIKAKGTYWWLCRFGEVQGWLSENDLTGGR